MSTIRFLDQENNISEDGGKNKPIGNKKRVRVPLGGKDGNKLMPSLNRSKSSIDHNVIPRPISRSSSSLGFIHKQPPLTLQRQRSVLQTNPFSNTTTKKSDKLEYNNNTIFDKESAERSPELYQDDSDSLKKQIIQRKPPSESLQFTSSTHLMPNTRHIRKGDPIKRPKHSNKLDKYIQDNYETFEKLINDENSIESGPAPAPTVPYDDYLDEEFTIFSKPNKSFEDINLEEFNLDDTFEMNEVTRDEEMGLNDDDLRDLLD